MKVFRASQITELENHPVSKRNKIERKEEKSHFKEVLCYFSDTTGII